MERRKWNIYINEKDYMIEFDESSIFKHKSKVYIDGKLIEGVKVILDENGVDYYFNIDDKNILIYGRETKNNTNYRIAVDGLDYEKAERVKVIDPKLYRKQIFQGLKVGLKVFLFLAIIFYLLIVIFPNSIIFMLAIFVIGVLLLLLGIKELKSHTVKYNICDSLFSFLIGIFIGTFEFSGIGSILIGLFVMVIAVIAILNR